MSSCTSCSQEYNQDSSKKWKKYEMPAIYGSLIALAVGVVAYLILKSQKNAIWYALLAGVLAGGVIFYLDYAGDLKFLPKF